MARKGNGMVGISFYVPIEIIEKIQQRQGKNFSEKLRTLIEKGLKNGEG